MGKMFNGIVAILAEDASSRVSMQRSESAASVPSVGQQLPVGNENARSDFALKKQEPSSHSGLNDSNGDSKAPPQESGAQLSP